jgi:hypothetical protein
MRARHPAQRDNDPAPNGVVTVVAMAVRELRSQEAQNDAGVILRSVDRESMQLEYQGRTLNVGVDRAPHDYGVYLPATPAWNDGTPIDPDTFALLKDAIVEILRHWKTRVEFVP